MLTIRNLTTQTLRLQIGFGLVLGPGESSTIRDEYAKDSMLRRLKRENLIALEPDPWAKVDERVRVGRPVKVEPLPPSRFDRKDPL